MKPVSSVQLGRAFAPFVAALIVLGVTLCGSAAPAGFVPRVGGKVPGNYKPEKPLGTRQLHDLNLSRLTREDFEAWKTAAQTAGGGPVSKAATPPDAATQFVDLTTTPRPPLVGTSTRAQERHPFWSWDQQYIFFSSNNVDPIANYGQTAPTAQSRFHIYRISSDGAFVRQITGTGSVAGDSPTGNEEYPALNHAQNRIVYTARTSTTDPGQLYAKDLNTNQVTQLTGRTNFGNVPNLVLNANIVSVQHPTIDPSDAFVAFAAKDRRIANDVFNIYRVSLSTFVVERLTNATPASGVECIDPAYHPDFAPNPNPPTPATPRRLVFAANSAGVNGGLVNLAAPTALTDHNLFVMNNADTGANVRQVTSATSDDIEPSFCQSDYPLGSFPAQGSYNNWLAFSSKGRQSGTTYDIYFYNFPLADQSLNGPNETGGVPVVRLFTPDTNQGAIPLNQTDERYPTWSASRPAQRPIDRIVYASNRQNNVNDPQQPLVGPVGDTDLWGSEVSDITPPTLFMYDEPKGEVLHIANAPLPDNPNDIDPGRRIGAPGDTFYFYAKLKDLQYGIDTVWVQIKDPDDHFTDSNPTAAGDHRLYGTDNAFVTRTVDPGRVTHFMSFAYETDYQNIGAEDYAYYNSPQVADLFGTARYASYAPGIDDAVRWSGRNFPTPLNPITGQQRWLRLLDDGNGFDKANGDGIFTATWTTPTDASDFYVDVIAYDKAPNPADPNEVGNWIIYDNIWGFSTQPFLSQSPVLYVDDHGAGQKWPRGLKGSFRAFPTFRFGTESDIIDRPSQYFPREAHLIQENPDTFSNLLSINGIQHFLSNQIDFVRPSDGFGLIRAFHYDYWRILAKGPVPETVFNQYLPQVDEQPTSVDGMSTIQRPVPLRAILWNAPYTGDIFQGSGSILDQATQTQITRYRDRSGRIVIAGGDLLWALTVAGAVPQQFAQNVLGADYVADADGGPIANRTEFNFIDPPSIDNAAWDMTIDVWDTWGCRIPCPAAIIRLGVDPTRGPLGLNVGGPVPYNNAALWFSTDGTPFQVQDISRQRAGRTEVYRGKMGVYSDPRTPATPSATDAKVVFMSFSLASMSRGFSGVTANTSVPATYNFRSKLAHSMFCWMFSSEMVGQIVTLNGGGPVAGAWVQVYQAGVLVGSAFSSADGTYSIRGLPVGGIARGGFALRVDNPGFTSFIKAVGDTAHAYDQMLVDVQLVPAAPGTISGKVFDQFNQPVPLALIKATIRASQLYTGTRDFFGTTSQDGTYTIPSTPAGTYDVVLETLPAGYDPTRTTALFTPPVTVGPAQQGQDSSATPTTNIDFRVTGQPGPVTVTVLAAGNGPDGIADGQPIGGAEVTIIDQAGNILPTQTTASDGTTTFTAVPAGPNSVSAFKFERQETATSVNVPQQNAVTLRLPVAALKGLVGRVVRRIDGALIAGPLTPPLTVELRRQASQQVLRSTDVTAPNPAFSPATNYLIPNAQDGDFSIAIAATDLRYQPNRVDFTISGTQDPFVAPTLIVDGRDGIVSGEVRENSSGQPAINGGRVELVSEVAQPGVVIATTTTGANGTWNTGIGVPSDVYTIRFSAFGYVNAQQPGIFVAGDTTVPLQLLDRTTRGQLHGRVRRALDFTISNPGVNLRIVVAAGQPFAGTQAALITTSTTTTPGPDGGQSNYLVGGLTPQDVNLPAGTYEVQVVNDTRYAIFPAFAARTVVVPPAGSVRLDFDVQPLPGRVTGFVKESLSGTPGAGIPNATVRLIRNGGTVASITTDGSGRYQTAGSIAPGVYSVVASHPAYYDNSATPLQIFVEGDITARDLLLVRIPPSTISGTVRSSVNSAPLENAIVELIPVGNAGPTLTTSTAAGVSPNYTLSNVSVGSYLIRASKSGWSSSQRTINVTAGSNLTGIDFTLQPEHVFGAGLSLISIPYDSPGADAAGVLEQNPKTFKAAYWLTESQLYSIYPQRDASEFRLGKGMFVRFPNSTAFTNAAAGTVASNSPFSLPLKAGWNMIGSVRRTRIEWLRVKVSTSNGQILTMQQAMQQGVIQNGLWSYSDGYFLSNYLDPFAGYFVRARADCNLIIPVNNNVSAIGTAHGRKMAKLSTPNAWQVARELAALGLGPTGEAARPREFNPAHLPGLGRNFPARQGGWGIIPAQLPSRRRNG